MHLDWKKCILSLTGGLLAGCVLLAGCANVSLPEESTESSRQTISDAFSALLSSLPPPDVDPSGETFTILTPAKETILGDEEAAGSVQNMLRTRNGLLLETYGIELQVSEVKESEIADLLRAAETSGTPAGDLLCMSAETSATLWSAGLLTNLKTLPYFQAETPAATALQTGASLYLLPDPSALSVGRSYVLFYDRALVAGTGLSAPESLVSAGNWTLSNFRKYAEAVAASVMNRTSFDVKTDIFGYSSQNNTEFLPYLLWRAQGYQPFTNREETVAFSYNADTLDASAASLRTLYESKSLHPLDGADAFTAFSEGRLGFLVAELDYIKELYAHATREYGILPLPKADAAAGKTGGYLCPTDPDGRVFSVPATINDPARSGLVLQAISAVGHLLTDAEKETYVTLYSRDNDQTCMLNLLPDCVQFDFGTVYGTQNRYVRALSTGMLKDVLADGSRFTYVLKDNLDAFAQYSAANFR